ncbi:MAG: hypothetical protein MUC50_17600 [Myxococcota bacterium]|jgi:hypothetical protein|nr:hypothetical protein [Myxococcota bacterium]
MRKRSFYAFFALLVWLAASCNTTPTVPVPPPEVTSVSAPNESGRSIVVGPAAAAEQDDIVMVFNYDDGQGVMLRVENDDGSFEVGVEAAPGDELLIQIKRDNHLSREEGRIVPPPDTDTTNP